MRRRQFLSGATALGAVGLGPRAVTACRLFPAGVTERYVAWQGDREVGRQEFAFLRGPDGFSVQSHIGMRFVSSSLGETTYEHESLERWDTGWLQALETRTRAGPTRRSVRAEREAGSLRVEGSDVRPFQLSNYVIPSNLWHRDARLVDAFIDVETGMLVSVRPRYAGKQRLYQGGGVVDAHRYTLRGQLDRDAWYDADCVLVRWDLPIAGGAWLSFRLQRA